MAVPMVAVAATAVLGIFASMMQGVVVPCNLVHPGHRSFAPGACERLEPFLLSHIVGQELAIHQFADATCDLLRRNDAPGKPLIMSAHGPPGVGKSLTHWLAARALYNTDPLADDRCPGRACAGYRVMYGMDYISAERDEQHHYLRAALLDHLKQSGQALLVIEEYDKLDCPTRALFRQLFENLHTANITSRRPIILLESNTGYTQLHQMLEEAGDRSKVDPEEAQRVLKDLIFQIWSASGCETRAETLKMVGMVDFFLPYLPLEASHIRQLFQVKLAEEALLLRKALHCRLTWDPAVVDLLVSKVDFEDGYAIEGAKEVSTVMTRHVSRLLRPWLARQAAPATLAVRRRQATDRFKHYVQGAVRQGAQALHSSAQALQLGSGSGAGGSRAAEGVEAASSDLEAAVEEEVHLRIAPDRRSLALEHRPART